jgi:hypothetical protein
MTNIRYWISLCEAANQQAIDDIYAERYWKSHPGYEKRTWENIEQHMKKYGSISVSVNRDGMIDDQAKEKLAAYRQIARQNGWEIGQFARDPQTHEVVTASARQSSR